MTVNIIFAFPLNMLNPNKKMIKNISIKNYKLFKDIEIKNINQFTLISGENNVGKTSLLEAIHMSISNTTITYNTDIAYRGLHEMLDTTAHCREFIFNSYDMSNVITIHSTFNNLCISKSIKVSKDIVQDKTLFKNSSETDILKPFFDMNYEDEDEDIRDVPYIIEQEKITNCSKLTLSEEAMLKEVKTLKTTEIIFLCDYSIYELTYKLWEFMSDKYRRDIPTKYRKLIIKCIQIFMPEAKDIKLERVDYKKYIMKIDNGTQLIPLAFIGDGVLNVLKLIVAIFECKNGIILIDNIDKALHYSVIEDVWGIILHIAKEFNCQIIATTHSYDFLYAINNAMQEENLHKQDFTYIKLEKDGEDNYVGTFNHELFNYAIKTNLEIR